MKELSNFDFSKHATANVVQSLENMVFKYLRAKQNLHGTMHLLQYNTNYNTFLIKAPISLKLSGVLH